MKRSIYILIISLLLMGCDKDKELRLPIVETLSPEVSGTTVVISGKVIDTGNSGIILGFCYAQDREPSSIVENQILVDEMYENGTFSIAVSNLKQDSTYYFKAFIANNQGYTEGNVVKYTVPSFEAPEAPCAASLTSNSIKDNNTSYNNVTVSTGISPYDEYEVNVKFGYSNPELTFAFKEKPITGVYTIVNRAYDHSTSDVVSIKYFKRAGYLSQIMAVSSGAKVYVDAQDETNIVVSFCSLDYKFDASVSGTLQGKFTIE
jgi:hypothetical protein